MLLQIARRPGALPALVAASLLLLASTAAAQDQGPGRGPTGVGSGVGSGVGAPPARAGDDADRLFKSSEVAKRALITHKPEPGFTQEARLNDVFGVVLLRVVLHSSGRVTNVSVLKGLPDGLTEAAVSAAKQIKFRPAEKDGRPVSQAVVLEYSFVVFDDEDRVERKAVILEQPRPEYTEEARAQKVEGKVVLDVRFYRDGRAEVGRVVEGLPHGLTDKAVEAAGRIKFTPAAHRGLPVHVIRRVEYVFKLR